MSGGKLQKRQRAEARERESLQEQIPQRPPRIPDLPQPPQLHTFGGEDLRPDSLAIVSNQFGNYTNYPRSLSEASMDQPSPRMYSHVPIPPIPVTLPSINGGFVDPYARTESMTNRGRYSYASSVVSTINNPRKMRRRKDPTQFKYDCLHARYVRADRGCSILVIGARNSGKSSFIDFLRTSLALPTRKQRPQFRDDAYNVAPPISNQGFPSVTSQYLETELEGERVGVTLWDSKGLENNLVDLQLREMSSFLESKFDDTFSEEMKVVRSPGVRDTHIHCVLLLLDPARLDHNLAFAREAGPMNGTSMNGNSFFGSGPGFAHGGLEENLDLQVVRALQSKTTVIPIISKADTITAAHMAHLKRAVWTSLKQAKLDPLAALGLDDLDADNESDHTERNGALGYPDFVRGDDRTLSHTSHLDSPSETDSSFSASEFDLAKPSKMRTSARAPSAQSAPNIIVTPSIPLSIISPDPYDPGVIGRKFPWGFADPLNAEHCDFVKLKEQVFSDWRSDLREASRETFYEAWRSERLNQHTAERKIQGSNGARAFHTNQQARF